MSRREAPLAEAVLVARVLGSYGALAGALLFAQANVNRALAAVARVSPLPRMRMDIVAWRTDPLPQSRSYVIVLAIALAVALGHFAVVRALARWPSAVLALEAAIVVASGISAFHASPFLGKAFLVGLVPAAALLAPFVLPTREAEERSHLEATLAVGLNLQSVPLAWGVWITTFTHPLGMVVGGQIAAWSFSLWRATRRGRTGSEALAGLPFTLLPIVGLLREPSVTWVVLALAAYAAIRCALGASVRLSALARRATARLADVAIVASVWGTCAIFTIPYRLRDLPRLNHNAHETGAYATVNSILHGRLMMADAGLIYGPLRSYALTLYTLVAGVTAEQVRTGQAVINHAVLGLLLALGWRIVDRRVAAMGWYAYLLLVGTLVVLWTNYAGAKMNAFGWADVGRIGLPFLAAVGGAAGFLDATRDRALGRAGATKLAAWGAFAALSTLWAQEFGACALLTLGCVPLVHFLLAPGPAAQRARVAGSAVGSVMAGAVATFALYLLVYAVFGRAGLFLRTVTAQSEAFTSGSYGVFPFPVTETTFLRWETLIAPTRHEGKSIEFVVPVAVYLLAMIGLGARALAGSWRDRDTVTLAITIFGLASFRFALGRSDFTHLMTSTLPAVALAPRLVVEALASSHESKLTTSVLRASAVGAGLLVALASLNLSGVFMGLAPRLAGILSGYERPSSGPAYSYPSIPRAGDTRITPEYVTLVEAIRANSSPTDKIFQHIGYMDGGEVYFLADRSNPTRYDLLAEFLTSDRQTIALEEMQADPPKLVVGDDTGMTGDGVNQFIKDRYHSIGKFGGWDLLTRNE